MFEKVAFVKNISDFLRWNVSAINATLIEWMKELGKYYVPGSLLRAQTLNRLSTRYWFGKVTSHFVPSQYNKSDQLHGRHYS